jgi:hypothetical protein
MSGKCAGASGDTAVAIGSVLQWGGNAFRMNAGRRAVAPPQGRSGRRDAADIQRAVGRPVAAALR